MLFALVFACTPPSTLPVTETTPVTDVTPEYREIGSMGMSAQFGYDTVTGTAVQVMLRGEPKSPTLDFQLGGPDWDGTLTPELYCTLSYDLTGVPVTLGSHGQLELEVPANAPTSTDCEGLDPQLWGEDHSEALRPAVFGVSMDPLTDEVMDWLEGIGVDPALFVGATFHTEDITSIDNDFAYIYGFEIDEDLQLVVDDQDLAIQLEASEMLQNAPSAYYKVDSPSLWVINP